METSINTTEIDRSKLLWQMTGGELIDIISFAFRENEKFAIKELPHLLSVEELSELTKYSVATIHQKNCKREIPGCRKMNGRIVFDTERILEWMNKESVSKPTKDEQLVYFDRNFAKGKMKKVC